MSILYYSKYMKAKVKKITKQVGLNVKITRIKAGISQEELAYKSNLNIATIGTIERGEKVPTIESIASIAEALNVEMYKFFIFD